VELWYPDSWGSRPVALHARRACALEARERLGGWAFLAPEDVRLLVMAREYAAWLAAVERWSDERNGGDVSGIGTLDAVTGAATRELTEAGTYYGGRDPGFARRFALAAGFGWRGRVAYRAACWLARR
jgi:hypothetical protein